MGRYYFDTAIWIDLIDNRNEQDMPKGEWASRLIERIIHSDDEIIFSDINTMEMIASKILHSEIDEILNNLEAILIRVEHSEKQLRKARDLAAKRNVPVGDALHALIARDNNAVLITLDKHFVSLADITKPKKPVEIS